jgi:hypothetical protein
MVLFRLDNVFDVYDASNKNISTLNLGETPGYQNNGGNVILIANSNFSRFYAFQRNRTEWVELLPEGNSLWYSSSENTAVVARTTKIYAFAPEGSAGIEEERINPPETILLNQNYPNPFRQSTTISFRIPSKAFSSLKITNALGTIVSILVSEKLPEGTYKYNWDATGLPAGVYFYQLQADGRFLTKKLILLK